MRLYAVAVLGLFGCASGESVARAPEPPPRAAATAPAAPPVTPAEHGAHAERPAPSAPGFDEADQNDLNFLVNARRAIAQYELFIEKAGSDELYAEAVKRSRERIVDLEAMIEFVESGRAARAEQ